MTSMNFLVKRCLVSGHIWKVWCRQANTAVSTTRAPHKSRSTRITSRRFVDYVRVHVSGGRGGDGCVSFMRLPCNEYAGPDGGDGGHGGHVVFQADSNTKSLANIPGRLKAEDGIHGSNRHCHGKCASHTFIKVPLGTLFKDDDHRILADLQQCGETFVAARGGAGGHGNHYFRDSENQAPVTYEQGGIGEDHVMHAELRVMAHVGLVGFPNAGKSTLLRALSRARPKVAAYPFTTLNPHVGIIEYTDHEQVAVADIPGLIPGAHMNHGLGFSFLRHIERCVCLLYVLDLSHDKPWWQLEQLQYELGQYSEDLPNRPHAIVANKLDLAMASDQLEQLRKHVSLPIYPVSAKKLQNIDVLIREIRHLYDTNRTVMNGGQE